MPVSQPSSPFQDQPDGQPARRSSDRPARRSSDMCNRRSTDNRDAWARLEAGGTENRLPGEQHWWIDGRGRVLVSGTPVQVVGSPLAEGRVCVASGIGVIERADGECARLGTLGRGTVELLYARFPDVRWAIADPAPAYRMVRRRSA